jgi:hypothetical protein
MTRKTPTKEQTAKKSSSDFRPALTQAAEVEEAALSVTKDVYDETFLQFVESQAGLGLDPLSDEAVQLQAQYAVLGTHPFDVLKRIVANPFCSPRDRISASKLLLEYSARKVPAQLEVTGKNGSPLKLDASQLSRLSDKDLDTLERLLQKAQVAE